MTANLSASYRLVGIRADVKDELAQANAGLLEAAAEIARVIDQDNGESSLTGAIRVRQNLLELRNELRRTDSVLNESDTLSFIIPNLICANSENKVNSKTFQIICDLLG